jgi:hypothetical protein
MAAGVLYFPYISVPEDAWFTRVLLYWDRVGSIVPWEYTRDFDRLSPYMAELARAELVRPIAPELHVQAAMLRPFLKFVDGDPQIAARARDLGSVPAQRGHVDSGTVMEIHAGKIGAELAEELIARGLARHAPGERWFEVEARTAGAFMAYLAAVIGSLESVQLEPITDKPEHLMPFCPAQADAPQTLWSALRMHVLEGVLPGPEAGVSVAELASFKESHAELLTRFRLYIESRVLDLASVPEEELRQAKLEVLQGELRLQLDELAARMHERNWPRVVFGTLCPVVGSSITAATVAATGALTAAAAGAATLASAIYSAARAVRSKKDFRREPLAYAALASERLR